MRQPITETLTRAATVSPNDAPARAEAAERQLAEVETRLRRTLDHLNRVQAIGAIGSYERYIDREPALWSPEMCRIFGVDPETFEATRENYLAMVHPDDRERVVQTKTDARARSQTALEYRIVRADGQVRVVRNILGPIRDPGGAVIGYAGSLQDVTEQRQTEQQLIQAQKMQAIGNLTGGIAHDFNNLLTVIVSNCEELAGQLAGEPRELAEQAQLAARRGADLASRLLSFARRQVLRPTEIDVNALVRDLMGLLHRTLGASIEIAAELPAEAPIVIADPAQLENALLNLSINARDAMPTGGKLTLAVAATYLDAAYAAAHAEVKPGDYVMVSLSDSGVGMPAEVLAQVFEPFFTTKEVGKGSGLGLSMVYGFAKQSRGHVTISSEPGRGTVVRLYLPAERRLEPRSTAAVEAAAPPPRGTETILVVEDNDLVRRTVVRQIKRLGYHVVEAADARAALARLAEAPVDLLFTDVVMPGSMNGPELAVRARAMRPGTPVLFTSGYNEYAIDASSGLGPAARMLAKPYPLEDLARNLRELLDAPAPA
jgi:PAS domain S-box-containing protein